jgi:serine/threonine-protein phosphatase 2A regulatory subunit B'
MVYNAMKLFMEINPQLFDDCSHEYTEQQNSAASREALRQRKWAAIQDQANRRRPANGAASSASASAPPARQPVANPLPRVDEVDAAEDNQKRLDSLKLQDADRRDRRPGAHDRQNSVGSARSQGR